MTTEDPIEREVRRVRELMAGNLKKVASEQLEKMLAEHPTDLRVRRLHLEVLEDSRDTESARLLLQELFAEGIEDEPLQRRGIGVLAGAGLLEDALELVRRLVDGVVSPSSELLIRQADILERLRRLDEAEEMLEKAKSLPSRKFLNEAYITARITASRGQTDEAISIYRDTLAEAGRRNLDISEPQLVVELYFRLVKLLDKVGDYDGAWEAASKAHDLDGTDFRMEEYSARLRDQRRVFTAAGKGALVQADEVSIEPLIILGNPRSGTSLLDQILGMHPQMAAGGELHASAMMLSRLGRVTDSFLPFPMSLADLRTADANELGRMYAENTASLRGGKRYLSDKSLSMHSLLGMLSLCLPRLRVINLFRHPLDNIVSWYTTNLLVSGHHYVRRLDWAAEVWAQRYEMQQFWPEVLDVPFLEMHYEDLVGDQEHQTRRILDFLDVPFDEACMRFHESERHVTTLSMEQVRQKMYTTSKGRWRNYEKHLGPAIDRLEKFL